VLIFFKPADGQVMAYYSHSTRSTHWESLGYTRLEIDENVDINRLGRDCKVIIVDGLVVDVVESLNPIQPDEEL